jgi:ribonucleoside-diphosphate reductase alpha chain
VSVALQYGVPLRDLVNKFAHVRFEPAGFTGNPEIPIAKSTIDYIFRWLGARFLPIDERQSLGLITREGPDAPAGASAISSPAAPAASAPEAPRASDTATPPTATAVAEEAPRAEARREVLIPFAEGTSNGNGHANGHSNGNGHATPVIRPLNLGATRVSFEVSSDSPSCADCGSIMVRNGSCYKCLNCGSTSGCS